MKSIQAGFRVGVRIVRVLAHVLHGYSTIRLRFPSAPPAKRQAYVQSWAQGFVRILGARVVVQGEATPRPAATGNSSPGALLVSNHISWLDIVVLLAVRPVRFVSKSEVAGWPVVGPMATGAGTLYIERASKRDAMRVMHHMAEALKAGDCVGVFPEGTTGDGTALLPFHANLLQAGISAQVAALPVVMAFIDPSTGQVSQAASYVADDTLLGSMWRLLGSPAIEVRMHFLPPSAAASSDRRAWAVDLHEQMTSAHAALIAPKSQI